MDFNNIFNIIVAGLFYIIIVIIMGLSLFGVYILVKYGRSRMLSLLISLVYIILLLILFGGAQSILNSIIK